MTMLKTETRDPRDDMSPDALAEANQRALPQLPRASVFSPGLAVGIVGVGLLGLFTFSNLAAQRNQAQTAVAVPAAATAPLPPAPPVGSPPLSMTMPAPVLVASPPPPMPAPMLVDQNAQAAANAEAARLKSPALVVDLTKNASLTGDQEMRAAAANPGASADEQFADRLAQAEIKPVRAVRIANTTDMVPQGAIITGVLETAINSDLPGYVRAIVSRDVTSFDGRKVLISTGSRLIGQYRSGLAEGQSRAFVIWTRLIRPDGVSVQIASPVTDPLGRAGLGGKVDSHFFKRFGSAILLSVIGAGTAALAQNNNGSIVVQSAQDAQNVAGIALQRNINIPPTVKVPQGAPIRIFIARDLDFAGVAK